MKYRVTCLTPTLVGDGQKLSPIDYMVWKDHVNVLDQRRIFRLLAKGPRLDGYLAQLKKAEKLDFASWGGFAQNFAGRRIPFEHPSAIPCWEKARGENLFIPTFAIAPAARTFPAPRSKARFEPARSPIAGPKPPCANLPIASTDDRLPRNPAAKAEDAVLGGSGNNRMRRLAAGDSASITHAGMKVYLLRVSTLVARGSGKYRAGMEVAAAAPSMPRRIDDSYPDLRRNGLARNRV